MKNYLNFNCITEIRLNNKKNMTTRTGKACEWGERVDGVKEGVTRNKTISDGGITVDFWFIKVHTSN